MRTATLVSLFAAALVTVACDAPDTAESTVVSLQLGDRAPVEFTLPADEPLERTPSDDEAAACQAPAESLVITLAESHGVKKTCATPDQFDALTDDLISLDAQDDDITPRFYEKAWCDMCSTGSEYHCCLCGGGGWHCIWLL